MGVFCYMQNAPFFYIRRNMLLYKLSVPDNFQEKFENFIKNLNVINGKAIVNIEDVKKIAATPKKEG